MVPSLSNKLFSSCEEPCNSYFYRWMLGQDCSILRHEYVSCHIGLQYKYDNWQAALVLHRGDVRQYTQQGYKCLDQFDRMSVYLHCVRTCNAVLPSTFSGSHCCHSGSKWEKVWKEAWKKTWKKSWMEAGWETIWKTIWEAFSIAMGKFMDR